MGSAATPWSPRVTTCRIWSAARCTTPSASAAGDASAAGALFTLIALEQCANDFVKSSDVVSAAVTLLQCAGDHAEALAGRTYIELAASNPQLDSQTLASRAVLLEKALMVVGAAKLGAQIGELLSDLRLVAAARSTPTRIPARRRDRS